jgi:hypothetical protein
MVRENLIVMKITMWYFWAHQNLNETSFGYLPPTQSRSSTDTKGPGVFVVVLRQYYSWSGSFGHWFLKFLAETSANFGF